MSLLKTITSSLSAGFGAVEEVGAFGDISGWVDTGSYSLNALVSGDLFGGLPSNKITGLAGEKSTGKTFFALQAAKGFLDNDPEAIVIIFDSESAITTDQLSSRGIDLSRIGIEPVATVEEFRTKASNVLDSYKEQIADKLKKTNNPPPPKLMLILDSIGNLSTQKETSDISDGSDKRDMTKQQLLKGAFRVLTIKCGMLNVPMIVTAHTYAQIGAYIPTQTVSGGTGLAYAASIVLMLSKSYEKEDKVTTGSVIKFLTEKSRTTREKQRVETLLRYDGGIDRYYGLIELAEESGLIKKVSTRFEFPDGTKAFEKNIKESPEKYFTPDFLKRLNEYVGKRFKYVSGTEDVDSATDADKQSD